MATSGLVKSVADIITCKICDQHFTEKKIPRQLPCMHVFCEGCIQHELDTAKCKDVTNANTIKCHTCKTRAEIPSGSAARLPLFFYAAKMRDVLKKYEQRHMVCRLCNTNTHRGGVCCYCFQCGSCLCKECSQKHDSTFQSHNCIVVTASGMHHLICSDHDTHVQYFCVQCSQSICAQCCISKHNDHRICELTFESNANSHVLKDFLQQSLQSNEETKKSLDEIKDETRTDEEEIRKQLKHFRDCLEKQIDNQYIPLSAMLDKKCDSFKEEMGKAKQMIEEACASIRKHIQDTETWEQPVRGVPQGRIKGIESLMVEAKEQMPSAEVVVNKALTFISGALNISFDELYEHKAKATDLPTRQVVVPMSSSKENRDLLDKDLLLRCAQSKPSALHDIQTRDGRIWDMSYLHSGELLVLGSFGLKVFSATGEETSHYLSDNIKTHRGVLRGVCTDRKYKTVVITEDFGSHTPGHLNVYIQEGSTWLHRTRAVACMPCCVAFTKSKQFVVTTLSKKLILYDAEVKKVWSNSLPHSADSLCVDHNNRIFVLLSDGGISVYGEDGTKYCE